MDDQNIEKELLPKERAFLLGWNLAKGARLTTADIAAGYEITQRHASRLMNELSRVAPIIRDMHGQWLDVELIIINGEDDDTEKECQD